MNQDAFDSTAKIAVLGAGSWGATLAWLLGSNGRSVSLWSHSADKIKHLEATRRVEKPLAISIPDKVRVTGDLTECVSDADIVLFCCTAQSMRSVATQVSKALTATTAGRQPTKSERPKRTVLISAAKGIELNTFSRMSNILAEAVPGFPVGSLSGPNLAAEVLRGLPTASVIACEDIEAAARVQQQLSVPTFRVYTNPDLVGVELGGALKNVIAIAAGAVDGLELGTNAKSALMTRGLAEISRMAVSLGGKASTLAGLAGMGDLVATCYSSLSRNYRMGFNMARGNSPADAEKELGAVAEGVTTAHAVSALSKELSIQMPIAEQVDAVLLGHSTPKQAIMALMARPLASE